MRTANGGKETGSGLKAAGKEALGIVTREIRLQSLAEWMASPFGRCTASVLFLSPLNYIVSGARSPSSL